MITLTTAQVAELNAAVEAIEHAMGGPVEGVCFKYLNWSVTRVVHNGVAGWRADVAQIVSYSDGVRQMTVNL